MLSPINSYPKSTYTDCVQEVLEGVYYHAQNHGNLIVSQTYGFNNENILTDRLNTRRVIGTNSNVYIARGRARVPYGFNRAWAVFQGALIDGGPGDIAETVLHLSLTVTVPGPVTDTVAITITPTSSSDPNTPFSPDTTEYGAFGNRSFNGGAPVKPFLVRVDLPLINIDVSTGAQGIWTLEGCATNGTNYAYLYPMYAAIFAGTSY